MGIKMLNIAVCDDENAMINDIENMLLDVKPQIISGDFRRLYKVEIPVTVCG